MIRERNDLYTRLVPRDKPADVRDSLLEDVRDQLKLGITSVIEAGSSWIRMSSDRTPSGSFCMKSTATKLPRASVQVGYPSGRARQRRARRS